jgi:hypothetical protein
MAYILSEQGKDLDLTTERFDGEYPPGYISPSDYPAAARAALRDDAIFGQRGDALLCLWRKGPGVAYVCEVTHEGIEVLGEDVAAFVKSACVALRAVAPVKE